MATAADLVQRTDSLVQQMHDLHQAFGRLQVDFKGLQEALRSQSASASAIVAESTPLPSTNRPLTLSTPEAAPQGNRRTMPRRRGHPVPVSIRHPEKLETIDGWVIDRSPNGLCLVVDDAVAAGTMLSVRANQSITSLTWFPVEVRNCRPEQSVWILGCQFLRELAWDDLRLFQ